MFLIFIRFTVFWLIFTNMVAGISPTIIWVRTFVWMFYIIFYSCKEILKAITLRCLVESFVKPTKFNVMVMIIMGNNQASVFDFNSMLEIVRHVIKWNLLSCLHFIIDCFYSFNFSISWPLIICWRRRQTFLFSISLSCCSFSFRQAFFLNPMTMSHMWSYIGIAFIASYITRIKDIAIFCCILTC